ncbi:Protein of unknown function DUF309 - like 1 [Theobroma cacao]|uniref:Uncharacterized protein LOC18598672 n=2 Tax=Theobroma cacao TaxID=3641 RepID=A0AB32V4C5_THECC|nr:PREDICTED: uncharacterized protein LOC18598672 [Theobroma cacao]EOY08843.1 Uncharacterized protein TCM_024084 [Theobroma cacao]WRX24136.1 Protein of unknown function DUF309 - like 1 [Theobroma cacao]
MALAFKLPYCSPLYSPRHSTPPCPLHFHNYNPKFFPSLPLSPSPIRTCAHSKGHRRSESLGVSYRYSSSADSKDDENCSFDEAVSLFNQREYYKCHDLLEDLWNNAEDPTRTLIHGILQCAVGFHHLFNQNHRGAMMELGEGLCKLRKMNFESGPFYDFEQDIAAVLDFIYNTQIELAACGDDLCVTMEQSERSYLLLGGYAAGQHLYHLQADPNQVMYIVFCPQRSYGSAQASAPSPRVRLPILQAAERHLSV